MWYYIPLYTKYYLSKNRLFHLICILKAKSTPMFSMIDFQFGNDSEPMPMPIPMTMMICVRWFLCTKMNFNKQKKQRLSALLQLFHSLSLAHLKWNNIAFLLVVGFEFALRITVLPLIAFLWRWFSGGSDFIWSNSHRQFSTEEQRNEKHVWRACGSTNSASISFFLWKIWID